MTLAENSLLLSLGETYAINERPSRHLLCIHVRSISGQFFTFSHVNVTHTYLPSRRFDVHVPYEAKNRGEKRERERKNLFAQNNKRQYKLQK